MRCGRRLWVPLVFLGLVSPAQALASFDWSPDWRVEKTTPADASWSVSPASGVPGSPMGMFFRIDRPGDAATPAYFATYNAARPFVLTGSPTGWELTLRVTMSSSFQPLHVYGASVFSGTVAGPGITPFSLLASVSNRVYGGGDTEQVTIHVPSDGEYTLYTRLTITGSKVTTSLPTPVDDSVYGSVSTVVEATAVASVPEPSSTVLMLLGSAAASALALVRRRPHGCGSGTKA